MRLLQLASLFLFSIGITYAVESDWPTSDIWATTDGVCTTKGCGEAAAGVLEAIDQQLDPCKDFHEFACGSLNRKAKWSSKILDMQKTLLNQLDALLRADTSGRPVIEKARKFRKVCKNYGTDDPFLADIPIYARKFGAVPLIKQKLQPGQKQPSLTDLSLLTSMSIGLSDPSDLFQEPGYFVYAIEVFPLIQISIPSPFRMFFQTNLGVIDLSADDYTALMAEGVRLLLKAFPHLDLDELYDGPTFMDVSQFYVTVQNFHVRETQPNPPITTLTIAQLQELAPEFEWLKFIGNHVYGERKRELGPETRVNLLGSTAMFERYSAMIRSASDIMPDVSVFAWTSWLGRKAIYKHLELTCNDMWESAFFKLNEHLLVQYLRAVGDKPLVEAIGVKVRAAFSEVFDENTWIEESTRDWLKKKLAKLPAHIGYNYNALDSELANDLGELLAIPDDMSPIEQMMIVGRAAWIKMQFDKEENVSKVALVNAYNADGERIGIPMGIISKPFFNRHWPLETHYAGIGYVIGHEFTHTYDLWEDRGLPAGNPGNDTDEFKARQQCLIDEFGKIVHHNEFYNITVKGNGNIQKQETISDNNGIRTSFRAYRKERTRLFGADPPKWPGLQKYTNDQLFFISLAQGWCGRIRAVEFRSDNWQAQKHPPGRIRINEAMKNFEHFGAAFKCPLDSPMNPKDKCRVWRRIKRH